MAGKYAFSTEIQRSYMDGLGATGVVDQTRLLEYCTRAMGLYGGKVGRENNLSPDPNSGPFFAKTEAIWNSPMMLAQAEGPAVVSVRCARMGNSSVVWESEIRQGDRLVGEVAVTAVTVNLETRRPQSIRDDVKAAIIKDHQAQGIQVAS